MKQKPVLKRIPIPIRARDCGGWAFYFKTHVARIYESIIEKGDIEYAKLAVDFLKRRLDLIGALCSIDTSEIDKHLSEALNKLKERQSTQALAEVEEAERSFRQELSKACPVSEPACCGVEVFNWQGFIPTVILPQVYARNYEIAQELIKRLLRPELIETVCGVEVRATRDYLQEALKNLRNGESPRIIEHNLNRALEWFRHEVTRKL